MPEEMISYQKLGPRPYDDRPTCRLCPACNKPFRRGDFTTLVPIGPGNDEEEMQKKREGKAYRSAAIEAHYSCVTGEIVK